MDGSEVPPTTEVEEPAKEPVCPPEPTEEPLQESNETEATSGVQEPAVEYHEVTGEVTHALEDEDDYEGANAGDEDEAAKSESLDADQVHDFATEDTDAPATVTGQESEFGGEQTEYLEYDERYGEDIPEHGREASPTQYGEPPHYEEEEPDTSRAVDETRVLPGGDEDDEDKSAATPVPVHTVLEPELDEPTDKASDVSVLGTYASDCLADIIDLPSNFS